MITSADNAGANITPNCIASRRQIQCRVYEVEDDHRRPLIPTLAGYKLVRDQQYEVAIDVRNEDCEWSSVVDQESFMDGHPIDSRCGVARFRTAKSFINGWWPLIRNLWGGKLTARINLPNNRDTIKCEIPVVLAGIWWLVPIVLAGLMWPAFFAHGDWKWGDRFPWYLGTVTAAWAIWILLGQYINYIRSKALSHSVFKDCDF